VPDSPLSLLDPSVPLEAELDAEALRTMTYKRFETAPRRTSAANQVFWVAPTAPDLAKLPRLVALTCYGRLGEADVASLFAQAASHAWLQRLTVMHCALGRIPDEVARLTRLYRLSLVHDGLREAPAALGALSSLRLLDLSENPLARVDPALGGLSSLHTLRVGGASSEPATVDTLPIVASVRALSLGGMPALRTPLTHWPALTSLALHGDVGASGCPPELGELTGLTSLALAYSKRPTVPASVRGLRALRALWLPYSEVTALPDWLGELPSLRALALHGAKHLEPDRLVDAVLALPGLVRIELPFPFPASSRARLKKAGFRALVANPSAMLRESVDAEAVIDPFPEIR
jgi:hypothetical protein